MRPVEWVQAHPLFASALLGLLTGVALGLAWRIDVPAPDPQRDQSWAPPLGLDGMALNEAEFTMVSDAQIWGDTAAGPEGVKTAVWHLAGIIADPFPAALVMSAGVAEAKRIRVGAALPDGGVVKQILDSSLLYVRDGCEYELLLYAAAEIRENETCDPSVPGELN
ncbi:MAG: hypothetical protein ACR2J7_00195 [Luteimonas sp.]